MRFIKLELLFMDKNIIFDFDGVIAGSFDAAYEVASMVRPGLSREKYREKFNGNIDEAEFDVAAVPDVDFFTEFAKKFEAMDLDKNVKEVIIKLSKNYKLFIVSSTINHIIEDYLERHQLLDYFEDIKGYAKEANKYEKFKQIFKEYHVLPQETIFITDTAGDIKEAKEAKINFIIGILGGFQDRASIEKAKPDTIVNNFQELLKIIKDN